MIDPVIRSRSARRARLFNGGTYFRARELGSRGNNISIELLEWADESGLHGKVVVTNHNTKIDENVVGPVNVEFFEQTLSWNERIVIDQLTTAPRALFYSISLQIAPAAALQENLGPFTFSQLFYVANKLAAKFTPKHTVITPESIITIKPRVRVYDLEQITATPVGTDGTPGTPVSGWSPAALRAAVNAADPWIEMPARKSDAQDDKIDDLTLHAFDGTYLGGGDGLPEYPIELTGPTRALVHINYGEQPNGTLGDINIVYEWAGVSQTVGEWKRYS